MRALIQQHIPTRETPGIFGKPSSQPKGLTGLESGRVLVGEDFHTARRVSITVPDREAVQPRKWSTSRLGYVEYMKTDGFFCKYIGVNLINMFPEI